MSFHFVLVFCWLSLIFTDHHCVLNGCHCVIINFHCCALLLISFHNVSMNNHWFVENVHELELMSAACVIFIDGYWFHVLSWLMFIIVPQYWLRVIICRQFSLMFMRVLMIFSRSWSIVVNGHSCSIKVYWFASEFQPCPWMSKNWHYASTDAQWFPWTFIVLISILIGPHWLSLRSSVCSYMSFRT